MTIEHELGPGWQDPLQRLPVRPRAALVESIWVRAATWSVPLACVATTALHLPFVSGTPGPDEGGFSMVARYAGSDGPHLYGPVWVDRPPLLIGIFWVADQLGAHGTRILVALVAAALVAAVGWGAHQLGGRRAAGWAAWTACALGSSTLLNTQQLNGEIIAAPFVATGIAAALAARRAPAWAVLSGACAASALLVKQDFADVFAFAAVLFLLQLRRDHRGRTAALRVALFVAGAGVPVVLAWSWSVGRGGMGALAYAMYGSRIDASRVIAHWSFAAPGGRLVHLLVVAVYSLLLPLMLALVLGQHRRLRRLDPVPWALLSAASVELVGVVGGLNFWPHYLIALVPTVALATGWAVTRGGSWRWPTRAMVVAAVVVTLVTSTSSAMAGSAPEVGVSAAWLRNSARPGDTLAVPFTHANVYDLSGLRPAYPYDWSLPVRTRDPHLRLFLHTLVGTGAPTWVLRWDANDPWGLDPGDRVFAVLQAHYRDVATLCGHEVWLRDGVQRHLASLPSAGTCGAVR